MTDLNLSRISGLEAELECMGVVAVVVTYQPQLDTLGDMLDALAPQVDAVVIVDNSADAAVATWLEDHSGARQETILLRENLGVAAAQNVGIARARERRAEYVVLFDQDSVPAPDMVDCMLAVVRKKQAEGCQLAAVGPRYLDVMQDSLRPFVQIRGMRVRRFDCEHPGDVLEVDHLISSGCLIPLAVLDEVGGMSEPLFIDYVDTEWCLRAWRKGYCLFGVCDAMMQHGLGDKPNYFLGRYVPVHKPLRHYYLFRNAVWLYQQGWIPLTWKLATGKRLVMKFMYFSVIHPGRLAQITMMFRGIRDGLMKRMGRYES